MLAKLQKKPAEDNSNDWLTTYSDMVTLLLTFFVMLYASSSVDDQKWQYIYQAFQSRGKYLNEYVDSPNPSATEGSYVTDNEPDYSGGDGELPQSFDTLYQYLSEYVSQNDLDSAVSMDKGAAHITIRFNNSVFFDGNSAVLKQSGKDVLNGMAPGIRAVQNAIQRVTVSGHTADIAVPSEVNDFQLSSDRAVSVVKFLDYTKVVDTAKFRTKGCGSAEPVASNDTEEGRSSNRRVEIEIVKSNLDLTDPAVMEDILAHDWGLPTNRFDPDAEDKGSDKLPGDAAQSIIDNIDSMFPSDSTTIGTIIGPVIPSDYDQFIVVEGDGSVSADNSADASGLV